MTARAHKVVEHIRSFADGGRVLVLTHENPDPDALAAAWLLKRTIEHAADVEAVMAYPGIIGRAENRAMVQRLRMPLVPLGDVEGRFARLALVDAQPWSGNSSLPEGVPLALVVDHHPRRATTPRGAGFDIRPRAGATTTICAEYLDAAGVEFDRRLATAAYYALRAETQDLGREATPADRRLFVRLASRYDPAALFDIVYAKVPARWFDVLNLAWQRARRYDDALVTNLLDVDHPEIVAEIADVLLRVEGVRWTLVLGRFAGNVHLSLRTLRRDVDAGEIMRTLVEGRGTGGGHDMIAGGKIEGTAGDTAGAVALEGALTKRFLDALPAPVSP